MKLAIMQPYFLPYLGYWQMLNAVDRFILYDDVNYIKNGWINRNNLLDNGKPHFFTLALDGASSFKLINETHINGSPEARNKVLSYIKNSDRVHCQLSGNQHCAAAGKSLPPDCRLSADRD